MPVYSFLNGIDPRLTSHGAMVVIFMLLAAIALRFISPGAWAKPATRVLAILLGALAVFQLLFACGYFFYPRYIDWMEPMVIATSWIGWRGGNFYPSLAGGDMMGNWYGPLLYQSYGFFLWLFGPSIGSSKILGVAAFVGEQFATLWMLKRAGAIRGEALVLTSIQCLLQAGFNGQGIAFGARADALLMLAAVLGMIVATSPVNFVNAAILGAAMGVAANLKIHGVFYLVPAFFLFVSQADDNLARFKLALVTGAAALASLALPFAAESVSLARYVDLFGLTRHHGFSKWVLEKNLIFLAMLWSPLLLLYGLFRPKLPAALVWLAAACVPAMAVVTVSGSVLGSGHYNLLSFIPAMAWAVVVLLDAIRRQGRGGKAEDRLATACLCMIAAFLAGFAPLLLTGWRDVLHQYSDAPLVRQALADIDGQMKRNPGLSLEIGPGPLHDLRVIPVFRGSPLPIDAEAWADLMTGGVSEALPRRTIETCRVDYWLMPATGPFFYDPASPIFGPEFPAFFRAHYRKDEAGAIFDRWRCAAKG